MRYFVLTAFILLQIVSAPVYATTEDGSAQQDSMAVPPADTTAVARKKHPWLAGMEIVGFNAAMVGVNLIINKEDEWSHINMKSISTNITHRYWHWDRDDHEMNCIRHPIHGSMYYLIARANGMSIGESSLYTLGGSWMWEIFCETAKPSINDMVYTTIGGITIGEPLWRSAKCMLGLVKKKGRNKLSVPFTTSLSAGYRNFETPGAKAIRDAYITWDATYGDLFDETKRGPFDYFDISGTIAPKQDENLISETRIDHQLYSWPLANESTKKLVAGIYNHFDFIHVMPIKAEQEENKLPDAYSYSEVGAVGPGIAYRLGKRVSWEQQLYVNGIMMGATPCDMYHSASWGYSFGSGYGARLYSTLSVGNWLRVGVRAQCSHLFTWAGFYDDDKSRTRDGEASIQGETGNALTAIIAPSIEWRPLKHFALVGNGKFMHTHLNYKYHPHASTHAWEWQVGVRYVLR